MFLQFEAHEHHHITVRLLHSDPNTICITNLHRPFHPDPINANFEVVELLHGL